MASFFTDCAKPILEKSMDLIIGEAQYLCCFKCIAEDFEKEKKELRAKWETMDKDIEVARNGGMIIKEDVTLWHEQASNLINENTETNKTCFFGWCPNCIGRYGRGKELVGNAEEARRLKGLHFESIGRPSKLAGVEYHSSQDFVEFESRNLAYTKLLDALKDERNHTVGLYSMGGAGKTTLVKKVGNEVKKEMFNEVVFTTVSYDPNIRKIQDEIANPLGLNLNDGDQLQRAKNLRSRLTNGQKILVILDDVWNELNLEDVGIPSGDNHSNCRVLITSRMLSVCNSMNCQMKIELELLSEKDASILFENKIGLKDGCSKALRKLAQQIASECKGLPIAITVIARSLKDEPLEVWNAALMSLKEFKHLHNIDEELKVYKCFQVSYEKLKDEKAKKLFLLCSMFPEDYEIPSEDLIRFGKGLGLFGEVDLYEEVRIHMLRAKRKLLDCCLLLQGEQGHVKMHDLARDAAHWIANNEIQVLMGSKMKAAVKWSTVKYLYFRNMNNFPIGLDCTKLEILISVGIERGAVNVKLPEAFFERTTNLRVLTLDSEMWNYWTPVLYMKPYIKSLNNIQTLCLRRLTLGDISFVEKLEMLDTLEFEDCLMDELPNGIVELKKLRLLSLIKCKTRRSPYKVIGKLSQIQELYFWGNSTIDQIKWMIDEEVFAYFHDKDSISPNQLQRYIISLCGTKYFELDDSISRALSIENFDPSTSNVTIKNMVQRAQALYLWNLQGVYSSVTSQWVNEIRGDLDDLIRLELHYCSKIERLIDTTNMLHMVKIFSKLEYLNLSGMSDLKELCYGVPSLDLFENLQELIIFNCHELRYIMKYEIEKDKGEKILQLESVYPKLRTLTIEDCKQIEFIIPVCIEWSATRQLEPTTSSELQRSNLECLPTFDTAQYVIRQSFMLRNVREMTISKCGEMKSLFSLSDAATMMLEKLTIMDCNGLKHIITNDYTNYSSIFPRLIRLTIQYCDGLQHMLGQYHFKDQNHNIGICVDLPTLKDICLTFLPEFLSICPNNCHVMLQSLEVFSVNECPLLTIESESHLVTYLRSPQLDGTAPEELQRSNLECLPTFDTAQYVIRQSFMLRNVREMTIFRSDKMKSLFSLSNTATMMLEKLTIKECNGLKHIITYDCSNYSSIFPRLTILVIHRCDELQHMLGQYLAKDQNHNIGICIDLPSLKVINLYFLPNFISICPNNCHVMLESLEIFLVDGCPLLTIKSVSYLMTYLGSPQMDGTTPKELQRSNLECSPSFHTAQLDGTAPKDLGLIMKHLHTIKSINATNVKIEGIFYVEELAIIGQRQVSSRIVSMTLSNLPEMTYICKGPKYFLNLQNLSDLIIERCPKLQVIFSASISRSIPELKFLSIQECEELEQIIEENDGIESWSNPISLQVCFPKLNALFIRNCNKLRSLFSNSTSYEFPMLKLLVVAECSELEEVFGKSEIEDERIKVLLPRHVYLVLIQLPKLTKICHGIELQSVECLVHDCSNITLTSTVNVVTVKEYVNRGEFHYVLTRAVNELFTKFVTFHGDSFFQENESLSVTAKANSHIQMGQEDLDSNIQAATGSQYVSVVPASGSPDLEGIKMASSSPLAIPLHEAATQSVKETGEQSREECPTSESIEERSKVIVGKGPTIERTVSTPSSTQSKLRRLSLNELKDGQSMSEPILQDQHQALGETKVAIEVSQETSIPLDDVTGSMKDELVTSLIYSEPGALLPHPSPSLVSKETLSESVLMGSWEVHGQEIAIEKDSISRTSSSETTFQISHSTEVPSSSASAPSQVFHPLPSITEAPGLSSPTSKPTNQGKDLVDFRGLLKIDARHASLLEKAIEKYPQLWDWQKGLRPKYCKWGYKSLIDMLLFLNSKTPKAMDESSKEEFRKLFAELESFGFDKGWLASMHRRVMDVQVDNSKLKQLGDLESQESSLVQELRNLRVEMARIRDDFSKYNTVFGL